MSSVRRQDTFVIDASELIGGRLKVRGRFSRTGIQVYSDGTNEIREYRAPEDVFDAESMRSLCGMPVTVRHPRAMVNGANWRDLAVGHTGDMVTKAEDERHTEGAIWLHDAAAIKAVQSKELKELSVGYTATLDEVPGVTPEGERYDARQRNIRGNHLALLGGGEARGGSTVRILDAHGHVRFDDEVEGMKFTLKLDGLDFVVELPEGSNLPTAWEKFQGKLTETKSEMDAVQAKADAAQAKLDSTEEELAVAREALKPENLAKLAADRAKLLQDAKTVAGQDVEDKGNELDIKRSALVASGLNLEGRSDVYIEARFDAALETPRHIDAATKLRDSNINDRASEAVILTPEQLDLIRMDRR